MKNLACIAFIVVCGLIGATPASADLLQYSGIGHRGVVTVALNGTQEGPFYAGEINWFWPDGAPSGFEESIYTYCLDPFHFLDNPQSVQPMSTDDLTVAGVTDPGGKAAWLFNSFAPAIRAGGTGIEAAGLQVAIWESLYDATPDLGSGVFGLIVNPSVYGGEATAQLIWDQAERYLDQLFYAPGQYHTSTAVWLNAVPDGQDQITTSVPEPATVLLLGLGAPYTLIRRRKGPATNRTMVG